MPRKLSDKEFATEMLHHLKQVEADDLLEQGVIDRAKKRCLEILEVAIAKE